MLFITGASGNLGGALHRNFPDAIGIDIQHDHSIVRADVADFRQIERVFAEYRPDMVVHLAAEFGRANGESFYENLWKSNCIGTRNIIDLCIRYDASLIHASSSEAYGDLADRFDSLTEELTEDHVPSFHNEYALTKWANEKQIEMGRKRGLRASILRFFNVYGEEQYHPFRSVVCRFLWELGHGRPISVSINSERSLLYIDDWLDGMDRAIRLFDTINGLALNLAGTEFLPLEVIAALCLKHVDGDAGLLNVVATDQSTAIKKRASIARAKQLLGFYPEISADEGIRLTAEWMREKYAAQIRR